MEKGFSSTSKLIPSTPPSNEGIVSKPRLKSDAREADIPSHIAFPANRGYNRFIMAMLNHQCNDV